MLAQAKCPSCGANLDVDTRKDAAICSYCHSPFVVEKAVALYHVQNHIKADTVNIIGSHSFDFIIRAGTLERYNGEATDVVIPNNVSIIGESAFSGCAGLQSVAIPTSATIIGERAFWGCAGLQSITIPSTIIEIRSSTFWGCKSLQSIILPNSLKQIGADAFMGCCSLKEIVIPDSVEEIRQKAFSGCSALQKVTIGRNVRTIGKEAFAYCASLNNLIFLGDEVSVYEEDRYGLVLCKTHESRMLQTNIFVGTLIWRKERGLCIYCGESRNIFGKCKKCGKKS